MGNINPESGLKLIISVKRHEKPQFHIPIKALKFLGVKDNKVHIVIKSVDGKDLFNDDVEMGSGREVYKPATLRKVLEDLGRIIFKVEISKP